uniref:Gasdermin pore forming domain-containing protein n=1 Tax=Chelonoidis abingdonii TaxID=106734 RepID=A0A8C0GW86_CHEAB
LFSKHFFKSLMFRKATKDLAKQLAPDGDLLPVSSLIDQDHFRPLYLVRRKPKRYWMIHHRYYKTGVRLSDILVPGQDSRNLGNASFHGSVQLKDSAYIRAIPWWTLKPAFLLISAPSGKSKNKGSQCQDSMLTYRKKLKSDAESTSFFRKINMDHSFIKDLRKHRENLYMINEAVQALEETPLYKANTMEGNIRNDICVHFSLKVRFLSRFRKWRGDSLLFLAHLCAERAR